MNPPDMFPCATGPRNTVFSQADPEGWVALLRSCHQEFRGGHESDGDALHTFAHILSDVAAVYPEGGGQPIWQRLFEQDIIPVVVQLLCDFDFDADIDRQGLDITRDHLSDLCAILAASLGQLSVILSGSGHEECHLSPKANCSSCSAVDNAFDAFATPDAPIVQAFRNIWNHRTPLLVSDREAMLWRNHCDFDALGNGLHGTVCFVAYQLHRHAQEAPRSQDKFAPALLHAASLCLTIWIYSVRTPHRDAALQRMISLLMGTSVDAWNQWYLQAATGCTSPWDISKAFLRDLSDPDVLDARLASRYMIFTKFRMTPLNAPFNSAMERLVFWYALASYRRQLCSGRNGENNEVQGGFGFDAVEVSYNFIAMVLIGSSRQHDATLDVNDSWLPLSHIHAAIPFMARATTSVKTDPHDPEYDEDFCPNLTKMISCCVRYVRLHNKHPEADMLAGVAPPSLSMRQFSHQYWHEAQERLSTGKYLAKSMWRPVRRVWNQLGEALLLDKYELQSSGTQDGDELPIAKRCAWVECLCNAYKPAHGLKLCNGCSSVAYCNIKCQKRDWENHRSICSILMA